MTLKDLFNRTPAILREPVALISALQTGKASATELKRARRRLNIAISSGAFNDVDTQALVHIAHQMEQLERLLKARIDLIEGR